MRRYLFPTFALLTVVIGLSIWWIESDHGIAPPVQREGNSRKSPSGESVGTAARARSSRDEKVVTLVKPDAGGTIVLAEIAASADQLNSPATSVEADLEIVQSMIDFYRRANSGDVPSGGLNEEILDQMRGLNDQHLAVFPTAHRTVNAAGQLLDRWGNPYFFHPVSRTQIEIRSAGEDGVLWTADDVQSGGDENSAILASAAPSGAKGTDSEKDRVKSPESAASIETR